MVDAPMFSRRGLRGLVCAADHLAASAGVAILNQGGNAADGAVATAAAMAVVGPHLCGLGGDMLAMVKPPDGPPLALLGVGRAGSGADPERLRRDGFDDMPERRDVRSVPVPGAVDGWLALHGRFGVLPWSTVLAPAITLAVEGFSASVLLGLANHLVANFPDAADLCPAGPRHEGELIRLPRLGATLQALAEGGREAFYGGVFGQGLLDLGSGEYEPSDLLTPLADWVEPATISAFGHQLWTVPAPSQGYLTLASAWIADQIGVPDDVGDPRWAYVLMQASRAAGYDRTDVLYEGADVMALLDPQRLGQRAERWEDQWVGDSGRPDAFAGPALSADGDTTHLCVVDGDGFGVSLTQSNAQDFGSHLAVAEAGVFLHNRGVGFSLVPGHRAEYGPRRRPPHTLSPACVTARDGSLTHVIGAMGGDSQPQINLQLLVRMIVNGQDPATAIAGGRVVLEARTRAFRLWSAPELSLAVEANAPNPWVEGLGALGQRVRVIGGFNPVEVGCAQIIARADPQAGFWAASDPRSPEGAALAR